MSNAPMSDPLDAQVRRQVYDVFMTEGRAPKVARVAAVLSRPVEEVRAAYERLAAARVLVLQESGEVLMANPFSAVPTPFIVHVGERRWWANCIWDAMGVLAMLGHDGWIDTACGDCNEAMHLEVRDGALQQAEGIVHFAVPAARWWANIRLT